MSKLIADQLQGFTDPTIITGPTPPVNDNSTRLATTAFVQLAASSGWTFNPSFNVLYPTSLLTNVAIGKTTATQALDVVGNGAYSGTVFLGTPLNLASGGTGLNALGATSSLLGVNLAGTALEYKSLSSFLGTVSIGNASGSIVLDAVANSSNQKVQGLSNGTLIGVRHALNFSTSFTVADNPGSDRLDIGLSVLAGVITGTGVATEVAFFTGSTAIGSNGNLLWDNTNFILSVQGTYALIETGAPSVALPGQTRIYADNILHKTFLSQDSSLYSALVLESRNVNTSTGLSGGGSLANDLTLAVVPNTTTQMVRVDKNASLQSVRHELNFIEGTGITLSVSDNPGADRTDITINSAGTGYNLIESNAISLTQRSTLNFPGGALSAVDNAISNRTDVTLAITPSSSSVVGSSRAINTSTGLAGGGALSSDLTLTVVPNSVHELVDFMQGGTVISTRSAVNFIAGTNTTISVLDNVGGSRADITISATAGAGGVSTVSNLDGTLVFSPNSGAVIGSLNLANANSWTAKQSMPATTSGSAGFNVGTTGTAPTSPMGGDMYATSGPHLFYFDGAVAHDLLAASGVSSVNSTAGSLIFSPSTGAVLGDINLAHVNVWTAEQDFAASTSAAPSMNIASGVTVTSPTDGDLFYDGTHLYFNNSGVNINLLAAPSAGTGFSAEIVGATFTLSSTPTQVTFGVTAFDSTGTQVSGDTLVCQSTGYYQITFTIVGAAPVYLATELLVNGGAPTGLGGFPSSYQLQFPAISGFDTTAVQPLITHLTSGDVVTARAWIDSGGGAVAAALLSFAKL